MSQTCYQTCNSKYSAWDPKRIFCKKGCDSDEDNLQKCKAETCSSLCIRSELGDDDSKLGKWSSFFSRAPSNPQDCLNACIIGKNKNNADKYQINTIYKIIGCNNKTDYDADD